MVASFWLFAKFWGGILKPVKVYEAVRFSNIGGFIWNRLLRPKCESGAWCWVCLYWWNPLSL